MFKQIKQREINERLERVRHLESELKEIKQRQEQKQGIIAEKEREIEELKKQNSVPTFFSKFFKTKKYKEYEQRNSDIRKKIKELQQIKSEDNNMNLLDEENIYGREIMLAEEVQRCKSEILKLQAMETFQEIATFLGESPSQLFAYSLRMFAEEQKSNPEIFPIIEQGETLTKENEKDGYFIDKDWKDEDVGTEGIILTHRTDFLPKGKIMTRVSAMVIAEKEIELEGKKYTMEVHTPRDTTHTSVNHEVKPHMLGKWEEKKYTILINYANLAKKIGDEERNKQEVFGSLCPVDLYGRGDMKLSEGDIIISPIAECKKAKRNNPKAFVIGYEGDSKGIGETVMRAMGYSVESANEHGFSDSNVAEQYRELMNNEGFSIFSPHINTVDYSIEKIKVVVEEFVAIFKLLKKHPELIEKISPLLVEDMLKENSFSDCACGELTKNIQFAHVIRMTNKFDIEDLIGSKYYKGQCVTEEDGKKFFSARGYLFERLEAEGFVFSVENRKEFYSTCEELHRSFFDKENPEDAIPSLEKLVKVILKDSKFHNKKIEKDGAEI